MSLSKILEEMKVISPYVTEDVESGPSETMAGRRGRKMQSIESMKRLKRQYKNELRESAAFIVVTGDKKDAFTSTAVEHFKCFSTNPDTVYEDLAGRIPSALWEGKESLSNLFDILGRHLEDKAGELDIIGYPQLVFRQEYRTTIKNKDDLVALVRQALNDQVGSEIVGIQAVTSLLNTAVEKEHAARVTPIILSTDNEKMALSLEKNLRRLNSRGVFLVVAGRGTKNLRSVAGVLSVKDPTVESVQEVLTSISGSVKNKV